MKAATIDGAPRRLCRRGTAVRRRDRPACNAVSGSPRAPYCMMGVCFDCLMEIDGVGNRQACLTPVADGMQVRRQRGARGVL